MTGRRTTWSSRRTRSRPPSRSPCARSPRTAAVRLRSASGGGSGAGRGLMAEPASAVRQVVEALVGWARDEGGRAGERASENVGAALRELGFVTQAEYEELELRVAQLEHRLRLVERVSE